MNNHIARATPSDAARSSAFRRLVEISAGPPNAARQISQGTGFFAVTCRAYRERKYLSWASRTFTSAGGQFSTRYLKTGGPQRVNIGRFARVRVRRPAPSRQGTHRTHILWPRPWANKTPVARNGFSHLSPRFIQPSSTVPSGQQRPAQSHQYAPRQPTPTRGQAIHTTRMPIRMTNVRFIPAASPTAAPRSRASNNQRASAAPNSRPQTPAPRPKGHAAMVT